MNIMYGNTHNELGICPICGDEAELEGILEHRIGDDDMFVQDLEAECVLCEPMSFEQQEMVKALRAKVNAAETTIQELRQEVVQSRGQALMGNMLASRYDFQA